MNWEQQYHLVREENETLAALVGQLREALSESEARQHTAVAFSRAIYSKIREALAYSGRLRGDVMKDALELARVSGWPNGCECPHCHDVLPSLDDLAAHVRRAHRPTLDTFREQTK